MNDPDREQHPGSILRGERPTTIWYAFGPSLGSEGKSERITNGKTVENDALEALAGPQRT